jgi:hypothetical protein
MTRLVLVMLVVVLAAGAGVAVGGISETVPTNLGLSNREPAFHGKVRTDVPDCESDRRVKLFRARFGKGTGPRELVGRTDSNDKGKWRIPAEPVNGFDYFAKAKQHIVEIDGVLVRCEPDFSRTIRVGGGGPD